MEDYKYKLSIIIPMYNCETYIANCLDSILDSDLPKDSYEVIIINDGSEDKGPEIAQEYCTEHENFVYLTQENQGSSVARNSGIQKASGEYLWFVDGDDKIEKNINKILLKIKELGRPDVFSFFLHYVTEEGACIAKAFKFSGDYCKLMSGREAVVRGYKPSSVCVFFIRKEYIEAENLRFFPNIYHQDSEFSYRMMAHAKTVYFSDYSAYIYVKHENTVVTATSPQIIIKKDLDDVTIIKSFLSLSEEFKNKDSKLSKVIYKHSDGIIFGLVYSIYRNRNVELMRERNAIILRTLRENGFYPMKIELCPIKRNIMKIILNILLSIYIFNNSKL